MKAGDKRLTVLLFLGSHCPFCAQSMEFYRSLSELRGKHGFGLVAIGLESEQALAQYLKDNQLEVDAIRSVRSDSFRISSTPTLIVADARGLVVKQWTGLLRDRERAVEAALGI